MAEANIQITANTRQAEAALRGLDRRLARLEQATSRVERRSVQMNAALGTIANSARGVSNAIGLATGALAAFATGRGIQGVIQATTTFEGFRAQLTAYLGDQRRANAELARLEELATGLPQSLTDLTNGFTVLTRYGIGTTNAEMRAFANIASANNKTISQLAEALGDALTGEYERLKEFGVKVTQENGRMTVRMGDQILGVANNATDLTNLLRGLGEEGGRYFGAAEGQANTLTGALSRLGDSVAKAQRAVGEGGLATAIGDIANRFSTFIDQNKELAMEIGEKLSIAVYAAGDAMMFLMKNIDYVIIAIVGLIGLGIVKFMFSLASMILGPVIGAFRLFYTVLRSVAGFIAGTLVRGSIVALMAAFGKVALVIGGVGAAVYGVARLIDRVFGTELSGTLENFAGTVQETVVDAINSVTDMGSQALDSAMEITGAQEILTQGQQILNGVLEDGSGLYARYQQQAAEARARAQAVTDAMSEQERAVAALEDADQRRADAATARATAVENAAQKELTALQNSLDALNLEMQYINESSNVRRAYTDALAAEIRFREQNTTATDEEVAAFRRRYEAKSLELAQARDDLEYREALLRAQRELNGLMTRAEAVQRGTGVQRRLNPNADLAREYRMDQEALQASLDAKLISQEDYQRAVLALEREYSNKRDQLYIDSVENERRMAQTRIQAEQMRLGKTAEQAQTYAEFEMKTNAEKAQFAIQQGAEIFNALGAQNKKAFEIAKAFNIANAIMNTYMAVTKALASYPPPFNFIAAGAALTFGLAQVAQIRSQQYSGRALGGPVMGNQPYIVGENGPELFTPASSGRITRNSDLGGSNVNVNFTIQAVDAEGIDDLLIQRRGLITQMISDAMNERGQRSMV